MMSCAKTTRLISEGLDHRLPWFKRLAVRLHLLMCRHCTAYRGQLIALQTLLVKAHQHGRRMPVQRGPALSEAVKSRIKSVLYNRP